MSEGIKFEDLDTRAKDHAMQHYAVHDDYHEPVFEQYTEAGKERGFDIEDIRYSGFWSQGDGASWTGRVYVDDFVRYHIKEDHRLYAQAVVVLELVDDGWVENMVQVAQRGYYRHSHTMNIECVAGVWPSPDETLAKGVLQGASVSELLSTIDLNAFDEEIADAVRAYADDIYKALEEEYYSYFNEEAFKELADANDWLFDESGQLI